MLKKKIIFLLGPTAIGKSAIAIKLAKKIKAEIISCDSMQVYRGMDILTSKVDSAQRKKIRHHLLDVIAPSQEYNVAKYRRDALLICNELFLKGKIPFFVGGTGLYYSIIIDGLFPKVSKDRSIRAKLNKALQLKGSRYLYKKLARVDAQAAKKIHPHDSRRIIRALEVYIKTGKPISVLQKSRVGLGDEYEINIFGLNLNRELLYKKIDQRVDKMFKLGLVNEVKRLVKYRLSKTAAQAIGIRELGGYFNGEYALEEARRLIQRNSRHYAKRQCSWFKNDKRIMWININKTQTSAQIALKLWKKLS